MSDGLYFIPIIERALEEPDVAAALEKAFCEIEIKGAQERYVEGCRNFELFMDIACSHHEVVVSSCVRRLIVEMGMGTFGGNEQERRLLLDIVKSRPDWEEEYEAFCRQYAPEIPVQSQRAAIQVSHNGRVIGELVLDNVPGCKWMGGIVPGHYVLKLLNTGWTIWRGELTAPELILGEAFRDRDLRLAAGEGEEQPTGEKDLLNNGEILLRTYAGIESGSIEIELVR
jgi:hypothetical protein